MGNVTIQQFNGTHCELKNWTIIGYPLTNYQHIRKFLSTRSDRVGLVDKSGKLLRGPVVFTTDFEIDEKTIHDTYLDTSGWGKVTI